MILNQSLFSFWVNMALTCSSREVPFFACCFLNSSYFFFSSRYSATMLFGAASSSPFRNQRKHTFYSKIIVILKFTLVILFKEVLTNVSMNLFLCYEIVFLFVVESFFFFSVLNRLFWLIRENSLHIFPQAIISEQQIECSLLQPVSRNYQIGVAKQEKI